ncbi:MULTISPECIES: hypothetical protein [unclassified Kribbella]|uniref:hypothetical protein n=1 Tax=unclassified Kribbella TaxID=2644121 RepID=UPI00340D3D3B
MAGKRWDELSPRMRRVVIAAGAFDSVLKIAALADLARRSPAEVRGSKVRWAVAITLTNSVGAVPIAYFTYGRRRSFPQVHR